MFYLHSVLASLPLCSLMVIMKELSLDRSTLGPLPAKDQERTHVRKQPCRQVASDQAAGPCGKRSAAFWAAFTHFGQSWGRNPRQVSVFCFRFPKAESLLTSRPKRGEVSVQSFPELSMQPDPCREGTAMTNPARTWVVFRIDHRF